MIQRGSGKAFADSPNVLIGCNHHCTEKMRDQGISSSSFFSKAGCLRVVRVVRPSTAIGKNTLARLLQSGSLPRMMHLRRRPRRNYKPAPIPAPTLGGVLGVEGRAWPPDFCPVDLDG